MPLLLCTLLGEGPSDDALVPIIERVLERPELGLLPGIDIISRFISPDPPVGVGGLVQQIIVAANDVPCDLLFVHHDADDSSGAVWRERVDGAVAVLQAGCRVAAGPRPIASGRALWPNSSRTSRRCGSCRRSRRSRRTSGG